MGDSLNKICKVCNKEILDSDEVAICEHCRLTYHKKCFEEQGCKNIECKISQDKVSLVKEEPKQKIFCTECGKENPGDSKFCIKCGSALVRSYDNRFTSNLSTPSIDTDWENKDLVNYIYKNVEYYIPKFQHIKESGSSVSWNWAAFFFNIYWFFYRKMYGVGAIVILANIAFSFLSGVGVVLNLVLAVCIGVFGNSVYLKHAEKDLESIKNLDENARQRAALQKGGVSVVVPIIVFFAYFIIWFSILSIGFMSLLYYY